MHVRLLKMMADNNWQNEDTEFVMDIKHHNVEQVSCTHQSIFTGRLKLQTILTLTWQVLDWSIYRKHV